MMTDCTPSNLPDHGQVDVQFSLRGADGIYVDEDELASDIERYRKQFEAVDDNLGRLTVRCGSGRAAVIEDELDYLVPEFCFKSLGALAGGALVMIRLSRYSGSVTIMPEGESVRLAGHMIDPLSCPRQDFMRAIRACGDRFSSCYQLLRAGMDDFDWRITAVDAARRAAPAVAP